MTDFDRLRTRLIAVADAILFADDPRREPLAGRDRRCCARDGGAVRAEMRP